MLLAVTSLLFMKPFMLIAIFASDWALGAGGLNLIFILVPLFQGVFSYIMMRFSMWLCNKITPRIGGIEFEQV
jgi:hypothetical protein